MNSLCAGDVSRVVARVGWRVERLGGDAAYREVPALLLLKNNQHIKITSSAPIAKQPTYQYNNNINN